MRSRAALVAVAALALAGCSGGGDGGDTVDAVDPRGSTPITARAVAAVALDHLPDDTGARRATYVDETDPAGYVAADLWYADGDGDADLVQVSITPDGRMPSCRATVSPECADLGGGVRLGWSEATVEDPGGWSVWTERDGATVRARSAGPPLDGDPREVELPLTVDDLVAVVADERLRPLVSEEVVAAGDDLDDWEGGEPEPGSLDRVPQTSAGLAGTFMIAKGTKAWRYLGPSPVAADLGEGAVGGRVRLERADGPIGPGVLDVAAVPTMPRWAEPESCREGWRCWAPGDARVVWRPARGEDPGESWLLQPAPSPLGGVGALHVVGRRMPDGPRNVIFSGYRRYDGSSGRLTDPLETSAIGLTTASSRIDQVEKRAEKRRAAP
ncbi:hypothetical protein G7072_04250 [Nocardioides sp. HDW12B]|uniref:hypothetical protein n=1 Tax=Nocardioides sp. HDW12B TaxID=2714939 RepID=UPI00140D8C47|nr:hypothetical protein [Nocardioides sp. HDW12B]QIK65653.1 hypothetical protein G7072_04250 [Nocardioides sp. HDW12B]